MTSPTPARPLPAARSEALPEAGAAEATLQGIVLMLLAVGLFSLMDALVKWLGQSYPTMQLVFFRSLFAFVPLAFLIHRMGGLRIAMRIVSPLGHLARCLCGAAAMALFFYCYAHMKLADAIAIGFAAPIFITALSVPMLGEKVGLRRWSACLVGFAGVLVMVKPGAGVFDSVALVALLATLFYALAVIFVRRLARSDSNVSIVFWFTATTTLFSALFLPFQWVTPQGWDWALLITVGLMGGVAQIAMTKAFRLAEVSVIMPFEYTAMFWAVGAGWLVWREVPGLNIWLGCVLVVASGLYILFREANLGKRRGIARRLQVKR